MSKIFDALQRSRGERPGTGVTTLLGANELLQSVEKQAAMEWAAKANQSEREAQEDAENGIPLGLHVAAHRSVPKESRPMTADTSSEKRPDIFRQIPIVQLPSPHHVRLATLAEPTSPAAEAFRLLKVKLQKIRQTRLLKRLLITSTIPEEGKSTISANLACALALKTDQRVLLLEGDLRRPSLSNTFGIEKRQGVREYLRDERALFKYICYLEEAGLWFLPAGAAINNPLELLQSARMTSMMEQLNAWFDWIVIDTPPLLPLADTSLWMQLADGALLVLRQGTTRRTQLLSGLEALEPQKVIGALINGSKNPTYGNYYQYYEQEIATKSRRTRSE